MNEFLVWFALGAGLLEELMLFPQASHDFGPCGRWFFSFLLVFQVLLSQHFFPKVEHVDEGASLISLFGVRLELL